MINIAVLLDLDNIKPKLSSIETICQSYGKIVERRAFSNTPAVLAAYGGSFRQFNYRFELTPGLTPVAQEVDNLIIKTVGEIIANSLQKVDLIAIVSNDNDYASLFIKLKNKGIQTLVIGNQIGNQLRETANYVEIINEVMRPTYVGIDLGTTNTVMALANVNLMTQQWTASVVEVPIKNEQGSLVRSQIIPSSVRFQSPTESEIGGHIKSQNNAFRDQTILAWKHHIGDTINGKPFQYELTSGKITPELAASKVLAFCREQLVKRYGDVQGAVITHPASYESDAIEATRKAAVLAGWQEEEVVLLSEPQAALYDFLYCLQKGELTAPFDLTCPSNIMVYDLGGGTLDITLHQVQWNQKSNRFIIQDIAIGSRTRVGGDMVDELIADYILQNAPDYHKLADSMQKNLRYEVTIYAEKFKKNWGAEYNYSGDQQNFKYPFQGNFLDAKFPIRYYISADKMREILSSLLREDLHVSSLQEMDAEMAFNSSLFIDNFNTFVVPVLEVLLKAKQSTGKMSKVDAVLLNGGMTYFPPVRERLKQLFENILIIDDGNPDLAVARGASLFAAGALKPGEGVNPTNIYLEVNENGVNNLRLLIAQGQKYPYQTVLKGFKLPDTNMGYMGFKAWVGMGSKTNINTTLQRLRQIPVKQILDAHLQPGCLLDMEVEYTFDERLLLTLVAKGENPARFKLEVASDTSAESPMLPSSYSYSIEPNVIIIPPIPRNRNSGLAAGEIKLEFKYWQSLAKSIVNNWSSAKLHQHRRELEQKTVIAKNRIEIIQQLILWLNIDNLPDSPLLRSQILLAAMALSTIFQSLDTSNSGNFKLEQKFQQWTKQQFTIGLSRLSNQLFSLLPEIPGKLFWSGFDVPLIEAFRLYQKEARSVTFLNSLAKCGRATSTNLDLIRQVTKNSVHLGQKEKAAWALGRLISPGQPQEWRADFKDVEQTAQFTLQQLYNVTTEPQVALSILGCLCQCVAWHTIGSELNQSICDQIIKLPESDFPVDKRLGDFPQIEVAFQKRLDLLPKMLNISQASSQDITEMQEWLLESVQG